MNARLQAFARASPVTVITGALRLGGPAARPALEAAAWLAGLLGVASYRHATAADPPPGQARLRKRARPLCLQARDYILIVEGIPWMLP